MANRTKTKEAQSEKNGRESRTSPARVPAAIEEMEKLMQRISEGIVPPEWLRRMRWEWPDLLALSDMRMPRVDVIDRDKDVLVRAEVPGVDKKDLEISATDRTVTIRGATKREQEEEKGEYYRHEISEASFARTVALPAEVDGTRAKASSKDGVIEIVIPKVTKTRRHAIKVD